MRLDSDSDLRNGCYHTGLSIFLRYTRICHAFQCPWEPHCHALIHLTCGAAILLHGRISRKSRPGHCSRNYAGYNYDCGQRVPIGDARHASGSPFTVVGHSTRHSTFDCNISRTQTQPLATKTEALFSGAHLSGPSRTVPARLGLPRMPARLGLPQPWNRSSAGTASPFHPAAAACWSPDRRGSARRWGCQR